MISAEEFLAMQTLYKQVLTEYKAKFGSPPHTIFTDLGIDEEIEMMRTAIETNQEISSPGVPDGAII